jgi:hypothetical protein
MAYNAMQHNQSIVKSIGYGRKVEKSGNEQAVKSVKKSDRRKHGLLYHL